MKGAFDSERLRKSERAEREDKVPLWREQQITGDSYDATLADRFLGISENGYTAGRLIEYLNDDQKGRVDDIAREVSTATASIADMARAADRLTMGIIIAGLFIGSSVVYYARIAPVIFGIPVIGFLGYLIALFMGLWLVRQIMREGKRRR